MNNGNNGLLGNRHNSNNMHNNKVGQDTSKRRMITTKINDFGANGEI